MVDAARLRAVLSRLHARLTELERCARLDAESYVADPDSIYASRYLLLIAIEDALSAANHVIASEGYRAPVDHADVDDVRVHQYLVQDLGDLDAFVAAVLDVVPEEEAGN